MSEKIINKSLLVVVPAVLLVAFNLFVDSVHAQYSPSPADPPSTYDSTGRTGGGSMGTDVGGSGRSGSSDNYLDRVSGESIPAGANYEGRRTVDGVTYDVYSVDSPSGMMGPSRLVTRRVSNEGSGGGGLTTAQPYYADMSLTANRNSVFQDQPVRMTWWKATPDGYGNCYSTDGFGGWALGKPWRNTLSFWSGAAPNQKMTRNGSDTYETKDTGRYTFQYKCQMIAKTEHGDGTKNTVVTGTRSKVVTVVPRPATCRLIARPAFVQPGGTTTLSWKSNYAVGTSTIRSKGVDLFTVNPRNEDGTRQVAISTSTFFRMIVENEKGEKTNCDARVEIVSLNSTGGDIEGTGCEIAKGASTCNGTFTWETINVTTPNLRNMTPGYERVYSVSPVGTYVPYPITHGVNTVAIRENVTTLSSVTVTASCVVGTAWDGNRCVDGITLDAEDCTIPHNRSTCQSQMSWFVPSYVSNPSVYNDTTNTPYRYDNNPFTGRQEIVRGTNIIQVLSGTLVEREVSVRATCVGSAPWNGTVCFDPNGGTSDPLTIDLKVKSKLVRMNERTDITWTMSAPPTGYICTLRGPGITAQIVTSTSGSVTSGPITSKSIYKLTCEGLDTVEGTATIEVVPNVQEV